MNSYERANHLFSFFALCTRLLIVGGAASTTSAASRIIKFRHERNLIQLVGKWQAPGRKAKEYYWATRAVGPRIFRHQAMIANIGAQLAPHVTLLRKMFGTGEAALIPDLPFELNGNRFYLECDNDSQPHKVIKAKVSKYEHYLTGADHGTVLFATSGGPKRIVELLKDVAPLKQCCVANLGELLKDIGGHIWYQPDDDYRPRLPLPEPCNGHQPEDVA